MGTETDLKILIQMRPETITVVMIHLVLHLPIYIHLDKMEPCGVFTIRRAAWQMFLVKHTEMVPMNLELIEITVVLIVERYSGDITIR